MKLMVENVDGRRFVFEGEASELVDVASKLAIEKKDLQRNMVKEGPAKRQWTETTVRKLWRLLWGDQAKLVRFLVAKRGRAKYSEIAKHMGYDGQKLSGILSPITRNSQTATGDRLARLIDWRLLDNMDREYSVDPDAYPLLRQVIQ